MFSRRNPPFLPRKKARRGAPIRCVCHTPFLGVTIVTTTLQGRTARRNEAKGMTREGWTDHPPVPALMELFARAVTPLSPFFIPW